MTCDSQDLTLRTMLSDGVATVDRRLAGGERTACYRQLTLSPSRRSV